MTTDFVKVVKKPKQTASLLPLTLINSNINLNISVDSPGIEPGTQQCECCGMPFTYEPFVDDSSG